MLDVLGSRQIPVIAIFSAKDPNHPFGLPQAVNTQAEILAAPWRRPDRRRGPADHAAVMARQRVPGMVSAPKGRAATAQGAPGERQAIEFESPEGGAL